MQICALSNVGAFAEVAVVPEASALKLPEGVELEVRLGGDASCRPPLQSQPQPGCFARLDPAGDERETLSCTLHCTSNAAMPRALAGLQNPGRAVTHVKMLDFERASCPDAGCTSV